MSAKNRIISVVIGLAVACAASHKISSGTALSLGTARAKTHFEGIPHRCTVFEQNSLYFVKCVPESKRISGSVITVQIRQSDGSVEDVDIEM